MRRRKEEDMQHGSLSIKQEKEQLKQIKQMKDDKKRMDEWEKEMEELRTKRSHLVEQQRQVSERQDALRLAQMQEDAAQLLQLPRESVVDGSLKVSEAMAEMLNTPLWMKRFRTDHQARRAPLPRPTPLPTPSSVTQLVPARGCGPPAVAGLSLCCRARRSLPTSTPGPSRFASPAGARPSMRRRRTSRHAAAPAVPRRRPPPPPLHPDRCTGIATPPRCRVPDGGSALHPRAVPGVWRRQLADHRCGR